VGTACGIIARDSRPCGVPEVLIASNLSPGTGRLRFLCGTLLAGSVLAAGCGRDGTIEFGGPVEAGAALTVAEVLDPSHAEGEEVVVTGSISEVCRSAGCWFVVRQVAGGRNHEVLVDLEARTWRVPRSVQGRTALVAGRLVGETPDRRLVATALEIR